MAIPPKHFIVFVPGYMGSNLRDPNDDNRLVWGDFPDLVPNLLNLPAYLDRFFEALRYPHELVPDGIVDDIMFVPPWGKMDQYRRLRTALANMGYETDPNKFPDNKPKVYEFAYDWRQDNRLSARKLGEAVKEWSKRHPGAKAWIIAHSNGGLVSRWYVEKEGGKDYVGKQILMGSPWDGTPKAMRLLVTGLDTLFLRKLDLFNISVRTRDLFRTFPSIYQLIPRVDPFLQDEGNDKINAFDGSRWLPSSDYYMMLEDGKRFNEDLGTTLSVETLCFFGQKRPTATAGIVQFEAGGRWRDIRWLETEAGDGTIPERSAVHPNARGKYPFPVSHGDIYVDRYVLGFLKRELIDQYEEGERAFIVTSDYTIQFEPTKDIYQPGEAIGMWASVSRKGKAVSDAVVTAQLIWRQALPGSKQTKPRAKFPEARLHAVTKKRGRYEGSLTAPGREGYYELHATVNIGVNQNIVLSELIAVEQV